jgi:trehalose-6-phosphate synthase
MAIAHLRPRMNRFYILWLYAVTLTALAAASVQSMIEEKRLLDEANSRIASVATSTEDSILANYHARRFDRIAKLVTRLSAQQGVAGMAVCALNEQGSVIAARTLAFPKNSGMEGLCQTPRAREAMLPDHEVKWSSPVKGQLFHYHGHFLEGPITAGDTIVMILAQDLSFLRAHRMASFARTFALTWFLGFALMCLVAVQSRGWTQQHLKFLHHNLRSLIAGRKPALFEANHPEVAPDLRPLTLDLDKLHSKILSLSAVERAPKGASATGRQEPEWLASLRESMGTKKLTVIANREPYIHQRKDGGPIEVVRPASGLVTALEPILRQAGGLWIGHGSGTADAEVVDAQSEVAVPPGNPKYKLRRVWLTKEEEAGYYYGFSNEGFWPLCHLAHTRPTFRLSDWEHYRNVNQKFTDAIPDASLGEDSLILVQDYHFALLPRLLRKRISESGASRDSGVKAGPRVALFWHIPWPHPEAFGICPMNEDLLRGMLGADVIGFHTQYHCNNFLETCNRYLEARIDYEHFTVTMENHVTQIRAFPIGIATNPVKFLADAEKEDLKAKYGIKAKYVAVGVDRLDYTKGLIERVEGVERFLEKYPEYVGQFSLVQMGSPSRSSIPAYKHLSEALESVVKRVNERFGDKPGADGAHGAYQPVVFLASHHEWDEIQYFYQIGDICMVTSLHDGMNLVAKEYVWCQRPDRGALILSKFTGASRDLTEAFIVNPYSTEEVADSIQAALTLEPEERFRRMAAMREKVRTRSAYHWASDLIRATIRRDVGGDPGTVIPLTERMMAATASLPARGSSGSSASASGERRGQSPRVR